MYPGNIEKLIDMIVYGLVSDFIFTESAWTPMIAACRYIWKTITGKTPQQPQGVVQIHNQGALCTIHKYLRGTCTS